MSSYPTLATEAASSPSVEAAPLIDALRVSAASTLGSALGQNPLLGFGVSSEGNFPYYYQSPRNGQFNGATYGWINHNLLTGGGTPVQLDMGNTFTNLYIQALSTVVYELSTADQAALNQATTNAQNQQLALLNAWTAAYGALPPVSAGQEPIDAIFAIITSTWAVPATTLNSIQQAPNIGALLNNTPASGQTILPVLTDYLNALGSSVGLQNQVSMNRGYLAKALAAVQSPTAANGGLTIDTATAPVPAFTMSPALTDIISSLTSPQSAKAKASMGVSRSSEQEYTVSVTGGGSFTLPFLDFFTFSAGGNASYFSDSVVTSSNTVNIDMEFPGVTMVNFGPATFDESQPNAGWYWMEPITEAIANENQVGTVSGFFFSPNPEIDFSAQGPFGLLTGVAISTYPKITITVTSADYASINTTFNQTASTEVSFLGIPLGGGSESTYKHTSQINASEQQVTITLTPPVQTVSTPNEQLLAWILGAQVSYPAAS